MNEKSSENPRNSGQKPMPQQDWIDRTKALEEILQLGSAMQDELDTHPIDVPLLMAYAKSEPMREEDRKLVAENLSRFRTWNRALADILYYGEVKSYRLPTTMQELQDEQ